MNFCKINISANPEKPFYIYENTNAPGIAARSYHNNPRIQKAIHALQHPQDLIMDKRQDLFSPAKIIDSYGEAVQVCFQHGISLVDGVPEDVFNTCLFNGPEVFNFVKPEGPQLLEVA